MELAAGVYHVTTRGDRRENIYLDDENRIAWLNLLGQVCDRFSWRCHAYCQMTNHYHIVIETPESNLSRGMRQLNGVYTQQVNRRHVRVGHVFQGRYKGILVEKETYLLELARYLVLNPVRANMVSDAADWPWSSYRMMTGHQSPSSWVETDWLLRQFAKSRRAALYTELVDKACPFTINAMFHSMSNYVLQEMLKSSFVEGNHLIFENVVLAAADTNNADHAKWVDRIKFRRRLYITIN